MVFETPDGSMQCQARWLVGADGAQSTVRRLLGLNQGEKEYGQTAVLAKIKLSKPHQGVAYERFTTQGPIALLPLPDDWASLVWTHPHADVEAVLDWPEATFLAQVQHAFGYRAGVFLASSHRWAYPLKLVHSPTILQGKGLLIGNAAHALHPVSGQGLNLGIEDIARVVEFIEHYAVLDPALEDLPLLAERLQRHHQKLVRSTDGLVRVFGLQGQWAGHLRALGLMGLDALSPLRDRFTRDAMGLIAPLARMKQGYAPFSSERLHK
jgi:2-octaprenyl-6-methoxyphenol hydroxylase